jgi:uncharacterized membrane protein YedE/YeeE
MNELIQNFGPYSQALLGGALIGLAASLLLLLNGRIAGISGILGGLLIPRDRPTWRALFLGGLAVAGFLAASVEPEAIGESPRNVVMLALAGTLVGVGTRLGNGCTSGHGVCGMGRFSKRSFLATLTFMATGIATVTAVRLLGGAS